MSRNPVEPHSVPPVTDTIQHLLALLYQWRCCFGSLKSFQSRLTVRTNINIFLWPNIHLNFINTLQDSIYLSLRDCGMFPYRDTEPSSQWLPIDNNPGPLHHLEPISEPNEPINYRRIPRSLFFSSQCSIPILGLKVKSWSRNINSHIKYWIWPLKPHQYTTMSSTGVKVGPTPQTPEMMRHWPRFTLMHQMKWREASECLHITSRSSVHCSRYPVFVCCLVFS